MAGLSRRIARPIIKTGVATYYSSEFGNHEEYVRKTSKGIHNQKRAMIRVPNKLKVTGRRKKSGGGKGG